MASSSTAADTSKGNEKAQSWKGRRSHMPTMKLDKCKTLKDLTDYTEWRETSLYVFRIVNCLGILEGEEKEPQKEGYEDIDTYNDDMDRYHSRYEWMSVFYLQTIHS